MAVMAVMAAMALWLVALTSKANNGAAHVAREIKRDQASKGVHLFISARAVAGHILGDCGHVLASNPAGSKVRLENSSKQLSSRKRHSSCRHELQPSSMISSIII